MRVSLTVKRSSRIVILSIAQLFFCGCNAPKDQLKEFNKLFACCEFEKCSIYAQQRMSNKNNPAGEDLMWALQAGTVERIRGNYAASSELFDKSEEMMIYYDYQNRLTDGIGATIVNDNALPYRGEEYDGIMVNTYKAINFMIEGKQELARVEFNRALDRQRRAKIKFSEEIQKLEERMAKQGKKENELAGQSAMNPAVQKAISSKYPGIYNYEVYPDFVNPFSTYLAGIYFNLIGEHSKAIDLLKESYGMVSNNKYIAEDFRETEEILSGNGSLENTVWVIFENGLGPVREEIRIDLPLFIATNRIKYVGIALPKLALRDKACQYLTIEADGREYQTELVADMDKVVQTEFSKDYKGILTRAIVSATAKAVAQYVVEQQGSDAATIASIAAAIYSFATTAADVRIWTTLPKEFQTARFEKPEDSKVVIKPGGSQASVSVDIPSCNNAIVYVRIVTQGMNPKIEVIKF